MQPMATFFLSRNTNAIFANQCRILCFTLKNPKQLPSCLCQSLQQVVLPFSKGAYDDKGKSSLIFIRQICMYRDVIPSILVGALYALIISPKIVDPMHVHCATGSVYQECSSKISNQQKQCFCLLQHTKVSIKNVKVSIVLVRIAMLKYLSDKCG